MSEQDIILNLLDKAHKKIIIRALVRKETVPLGHSGKKMFIVRIVAMAGVQVFPPDWSYGAVEYTHKTTSKSQTDLSPPVFGMVPHTSLVGAEEMSKYLCAPFQLTATDDPSEFQWPQTDAEVLFIYQNIGYSPQEVEIDDPFFNNEIKKLHLLMNYQRTAVDKDFFNSAFSRLGTFIDHQEEQWVSLAVQRRLIVT